MSVDVPLDNIKINNFQLAGAAGVNLTVALPDPIALDLGLDADLGLDEIRIRELPPISVGISELPQIRVGITELPTIRTDSTVSTASTLSSDSQVDLGLDDIRITELPRIDVQLGLRPMRFHLPLHFRFCLKLFGHTVLEIDTCGEAMAVAEDVETGSPAVGAPGGLSNPV